MKVYDLYVAAKQFGVLPAAGGLLDQEAATACAFIELAKLDDCLDRKMQEAMLVRKAF